MFVYRIGERTFLAHEKKFTKSEFDIMVNNVFDEAECILSNGHFFGHFFDPNKVYDWQDLRGDETIYDTIAECLIKHYDFEYLQYLQYMAWYGGYWEGEL